MEPRAMLTSATATTPIPRTAAVTRSLSRLPAVAALIWVALTLLAWPPAASAAYRWVDADGNVHYAQSLDAVPERYRAGAREVPEATVRRGEPAAGRQRVLDDPRIRAHISSGGANSQQVPRGDLRQALRDACDADAPRDPAGAQWRPTVDAVVAKLSTPVLRADLGGATIPIVIVDSRLARLYAPAFACLARPGREPSIVLTVEFLREFSSRGGFDGVLAATLAHEFAHHVLHAKGPHARLPYEDRERQADELGIYYYERAGYDCRDYRTSRDKDAARAACDLAKRGARLH